MRGSDLTLTGLMGGNPVDATMETMGFTAAQTTAVPGLRYLGFKFYLFSSPFALSAVIIDVSVVFHKF